jgi:type II secretory pathway pseudopilin PulG
VSFPASPKSAAAQPCHRRSARRGRPLHGKSKRAVPPVFARAPEGALRPSKTRSQQGLSLVETAALISLTGILLAAFAPTFFRQLRMSKIAEAVEALDSLYRGTAAYYAQERVLSDGKRARRCLPPSAGPTPEKPGPDPQIVDFEAPQTDPTWRALGMSGQQPLRYSYRLLVAQPGCEPRGEPVVPAVTFQASGDLDGDGVLSNLERAAVLSQDQATLESTGPLHIRQRVE